MPESEEATFKLTIDNIEIAVLSCKDGVWKFQYTEEFKTFSDRYNHITGFSDLDKVYESELLWPFFQVRIPGLNQPVVRETLEKENIEKTNELALLKRFGAVCATNPYRLLEV
ncbi:MAG: hypothetical protein AAGN35_24470 [Bacteroidota bacterium]